MGYRPCTRLQSKFLYKTLLDTRNNIPLADEAKKKKGEARPCRDEMILPITFHAENINLLF